MEMGRPAAALFFVICGIFCSHGAHGMNQISADVFSGNIIVTDDTHIAAGVRVVADKINITESVRIFNEAAVRGDIHVCDGCDFTIRNSGNYSGRVHLGTDSTMTQIVRVAADLTYMDADAPYVVLADDARDISWNDLAALGRYAGTLVVRDSRVVMSDLISQFATCMRQSARIILQGTVTLALPRGYDINDAPVIENIAGDAGIVIEGAAPGPLHAYVANVRDGGLYINLVRETDYYKILGDRRGIFLNAVRELWPDDALLGRLDAADSMDALRHIMSHSVAFNPARMLRPMRILDYFMTDSVGAGARFDVPGGTGARPFYISAGDEAIAGAVTDFSLRIGDGLSGGVSLYAGTGENDDAVNAFSATMFGGRAFANYDSGYFNMRALAGLTYADFDAPYIFDNGRIRNSANGRAEYGVVDVGVTLGAVAPYIGVGARREHMLSRTKNYTAARTGVDAAYRMQVSDIEYEYKFKAGTDSLHNMHAGAGVGFWSPDDGAGGGISVDSVHDGQDWAYMFSLNVRMRF